jgi:hypothetical protein
LRIFRGYGAAGEAHSERAWGDQYEQEADRIANAVMHQEQQGSAGSSETNSIHRQMPEEEKDKLQGKFRGDQIRRRVEEEEENDASQVSRRSDSTPDGRGERKANLKPAGVV